jgi:hypothetical protein
VFFFTRQRTEPCCFRPGHICHSLLVLTGPEQVLFEMFWFSGIMQPSGLIFDLAQSGWSLREKPNLISGNGKTSGLSSTLPRDQTSFSLLAAKEPDMRLTTRKMDVRSWTILQGVKVVTALLFCQLSYHTDCLLERSLGSYKHFRFIQAIVLHIVGAITSSPDDKLRKQANLHLENVYASKRNS